MREVVVYLSKRICEQRRSFAAGLGGQKITSPANLCVRIGMGIDIQEASLLLISLRDGLERRMIVVPTVIAYSHQHRGNRIDPPFIRVPITTDQASAIELIASIGRNNDKTCGMQPRLSGGPKFLDKVPHDVDHAPLNPPARMRQVVIVEIRAIVHGESNVAVEIFRARTKAVDHRIQTQYAKSKVVDQTDVVKERHMVVAIITIATDKGGVIRQYRDLHCVAD